MKNILLFLLMLVTTSLYSQLITEKIYPVDGNNELGDMILTSDQHLMLITCTDNAIHLIKVGTDGEPVWTKTFTWDVTPVVLEAAETPDGGFLLAGAKDYNGLLMKISASGDSLWSRLKPALPEFPIEATTVSVFNDGTIVASWQENSQTGPPVSFFELLDENGNPLSAILRDADQITRTLPFTDTSFIYSGNAYLSADQGTVIAERSKSGNNIHTVQVPDVYNIDFARSIDGEYFIAAHSSQADLIKTDQNGTIEWAVTYQPDMISTNADVCLHDTLIFATGGLASGNDQSMYVAVCNTHGQLLNLYLAGEYDYQSGVKMHVVNDMVYVAGNIDTGNDQEIFLDIFALDSLVTSVDEPALSARINLHVFPNPARDFVIVSYSFDTETEGAISISDIKGQPVHNMSFSGKKDQVTIVTGSWTAGVYVINLTVDGKTRESVKFTLVK